MLSRLLQVETRVVYKTTVFNISPSSFRIILAVIYMLFLSVEFSEFGQEYLKYGREWFVNYSGELFLFHASKIHFQKKVLSAFTAQALEKAKLLWKQWNELSTIKKANLTKI